MSTWQMIAAQHLLGLREVLVRHDENVKAYKLMTECVPYIAVNRRDVQQAIEDQVEMTKHAFDPAEAAKYYTNNVHDRPFEEQMLFKATSDLWNVQRFQVARDEILRKGFSSSVLDLACNDGILGAALREVGHTGFYCGVDLSEACIGRAHARKIANSAFFVRDILDYDDDLQFDVVVMYEVLEHVLRPKDFVSHALSFVKPGGVLLTSTPLEAMLNGDLMDWYEVEPKGHIHAFTIDQFADMLRPENAGDYEANLALTPDHLMIGKIVMPGG